MISPVYLKRLLSLRSADAELIAEAITEAGIPTDAKTVRLWLRKRNQAVPTAPFTVPMLLATIRKLAEANCED